MLLDKLKAYGWMTAAIAAGSLLAVQSVRLHHAHLDAAHARTALATHTAAAERAARLQSEKYRTLEAQHRDHITRIDTETAAALAAARFDASRAAGTAERLRSDLASYITTHRARAQAAAATRQCAPDSGPALDLLADLFQRADTRAGALAAFADDAHTRGAGCERSYDAVANQ